MAVCWDSAITTDQDMEKKKWHLGNLIYVRETTTKQFKYHVFCKQCECYKVQKGKTNSILNFTSKWDIITDIYDNKNLLHECEHIENYSNNTLNFYPKIMLSLCAVLLQSSHNFSETYSIYYSQLPFWFPKQYFNYKTI